MLCNMETTGTKAQEAFEAAKGGERVGVYARLTGEMSDGLYECFRNLNITERMSVRVTRGHDYLELEWDNGGALYLHQHHDGFRGRALDRCFVPECMDVVAYETVRPTLATSGRKLDRY